MVVQRCILEAESSVGDTHLQVCAHNWCYCDTTSKRFSAVTYCHVTLLKQSKLTQALQDYLGGGALVLAIACISRSDEETATTCTMNLLKSLHRATHYPVSNLYYWSLMFAIIL
jgi:hypothetical protein